MSLLDHRVCLLLGSNIQPEQNIPQAIELLRRQVTIFHVSSVWQSPPVGFDGLDFLNLAVLVSSPLAPVELKEQVLRPLEAQMGRVRSSDKNAPRPIDIDIILFDEHVLDPTLFLYAHRAVPVAEIMPELLSPQGESLEKLASRLSRTTLIRLKPGIVDDKKYGISSPKGHH